MNIELFYNKIKNAVQAHGITEPALILSCGFFLKSLQEIITDESIADMLKMTRMTVLFEGFYRGIESEFPLKKQLTDIRLQRWANHYGTPTIVFLLTYAFNLQLTCNLFRHPSSSPTVNDAKPWDVTEKKNLALDSQNDVIVNQQATSNVEMPAEDEKTGRFLKTHNPSGGFTTTPCDMYSQKFIEYANTVATNGGKVLEIGAAFGAASLEAIAQGATVFCNDIDANNLAVIRNRHLKKSNNHNESITGDDTQLVLVPGSFPEELAGLPTNFFDAILICRVLHFFTGEQIEKSLEQLSTHLKPGGKLFVVCETPFLKNWQRFLPEFEKRIAGDIKWPGEITNPADYESSGRAASLPKFVHWITKEILERSIIKSKLGVEHLSYIDRRGQFPNDLLLDGRESVGAVAAKPYKI